MAFTGVRNFVIAPITAYTEGSEPTYGAGMKVGHATRVQVDWNTSDGKLFGDNVLVESSKEATSGTITVGTTTIEKTGRMMMLGYVEGGTSSNRTYHKTDANPPIIGCGYVVKNSNDGAPIYESHWHYRTQFGMNQSVDTRRESTEYQTPEMSGDILATVIDNTGANNFEEYKEFSTETAAVAYINEKAGISTATGG